MKKVFKTAMMVIMLSVTVMYLGALPGCSKKAEEPPKSAANASKTKQKIEGPPVATGKSKSASTVAVAEAAPAKPEKEKKEKKPKYRYQKERNIQLSIQKTPGREEWCIYNKSVSMGCFNKREEAIAAAEQKKAKRNPFTPIKIKGMTPLRLYDVSQLAVNGVIIYGVKKANIVTPDCRSMEVVVGDPIGIHSGRVVDITLDGVRVRETFVDYQGKLKEYERFIKNRPYSCK